MLNCPKCNNTLEDEAKFCDQCGLAISLVYCTECGEKNIEGTKHCSACGTALDQNESKDVKDSKRRKSANILHKVRKMPIWVFAVAVVLILVIVAVPILASKTKSQALSVAYIKDNEIHFTFLNKISPFEITENLCGDEEADLESVYGISDYVSYSEDGETIFYPDRVSDESDGFSLYYRDLRAETNKQDSSVRIDVDVTNYVINNSGTLAVYTKGPDDNLYVNNLTDKVKIDTNVYFFQIDKSGSKIVYATDEGTIYEKSLKSEEEDKEKIDSNARLLYVSEDLDAIFYDKEGSLYKKKSGKDKEKVSSDVVNIFSVNDSGTLYFIKRDSSEVKLSNYVTDDMAEADANIFEPQIEAFQTEELVQGWYSSYWTTVTDYDAYYDAFYRYEDKLTRDWLRLELEEEAITITNDTLYYYDGETAVAISDQFDSYEATTTEEAALIYTKQIRSNVPEIKLSEILSVSNVEYLVEEALASSTETFVAVKGKETAIEQTNARYFSFNNTGSALYYVDECSEEDGHGVLLTAKIESDTISPPAKVDDDVYYIYMFKQQSDSIMYFKDVKGHCGDLYVDGEMVDPDVSIYSVTTFADSPAVVYLMDYSKNSNLGSVRIYDGKDAVKIADDVSTFVALDAKNIALLIDYNYEKERGDAYLYDGSSELKLIDTDITGFLDALYYEYFQY